MRSLKLKVLSTLAFFITLSLCLVLPAFSGQGIRTSAALNSFIIQVEQTYLSSRGIKFSNIASRDPVSAARLLGVGTIPQAHYGLKSPSQKQRYFRLMDEINAFLKQLAHIHQANKISYDQLWNAFEQGGTGRNNDWAIANFGVDPMRTQLPSVLHMVSDTPSPIPERRGRIPMGEPKRDDGGAVDLMGKRANEVVVQRPGNDKPPSRPQPREPQFRWQVLGIYKDLKWHGGGYKTVSTLGNPERPIITAGDCGYSTGNQKFYDKAKVVPCKAVSGTCVYKVRLLRNSHLGRKGEVKCLLHY